MQTIKLLKLKHSILFIATSCSRVKANQSNYIPQSLLNSISRLLLIKFVAIFVFFQRLTLGKDSGIDAAKHHEYETCQRC